MYKNLEMTNAEMQEIFDCLPKHLAKKLMAKVKPDSGIHILKSFVEQYDDDHMGDHMLASCLSDIIHKTMICMREIDKEAKDNGEKGISSLQLAIIMVETLKNIASGLGKAIDGMKQEDSEREQKPE